MQKREFLKVKYCIHPIRFNYFRCIVGLWKLELLTQYLAELVCRWGVWFLSAMESGAVGRSGHIWLSHRLVDLEKRTVLNLSRDRGAFVL